VPNSKVVHAVLQRLAALVGLSVDLGGLVTAGAELEAQIEQALQGRDDLQEYLRQLEAAGSERWDPLAVQQDEPSSGEAPSTESIIDDLESFHRQLNDDEEDEEDEA
jgi:hypothetical protein